MLLSRLGSCCNLAACLAMPLCQEIDINLINEDLSADAKQTACKNYSQPQRIWKKRMDNRTTYKETPTGRKQKVEKKGKTRAHMNKPEHPKISLRYCFSLGPKMK